VLGAFEQLIHSDDVNAFRSLIGHFQALRQPDKTIASLKAIARELRPTSVARDTIAKIERTLGADIIRILTPDLLDHITEALKDKDTQRARLALQRLQEVVKIGVNFPPVDATVLLRPGLLNWKLIPTLLGAIGDFYAGRGYDAEYSKAYRGFLSACSDIGRGKSWQQVSNLPAGDSAVCVMQTQQASCTCGDLFTQLYSYKRVNAGAPSRIKDRIGATPTVLGKPLAALITTSIVTQKSLQDFEQARAHYLATNVAQYKPNFDDIKFGYFGARADLERVQKNLRDPRVRSCDPGSQVAEIDLKSEKFYPLPDQTWELALEVSPAEPGLSAIRPMRVGSEPIASAGGWSDLTPTLALRALGCETVAYVTRPNPDAFSIDAARALGMNDDDFNRLFAVTPPTQNLPKSSWLLSNECTDITACFNWDDGFTTAPDSLLAMAEASYYSDGSRPAPHLMFAFGPEAANKKSLFPSVDVGSAPPECKPF
jgi:hypothetical protein